jgi:hypothetical protein
MPIRLALYSQLTMLAALITLAAVPVRANVPAVTKILQSAGSHAVVRAPKTVDEATRDQIDSMAKDAAAKSGAKVYVVVLPESEAPHAYRGVYPTVGMHGKDTLIVTNGPAWDLHCNAMSAAAKQELLAKAMKGEAKPLDRMEALLDGLPAALASAKTGKAMTWNEFEHQHAGKGWNSARMSEEYRKHVQAAEAGILVPVDKPAVVESSPGMGWGFGFFAVVVAAIVGTVIWRRRNRDRELAGAFKIALQGPESALADVYLDVDETNPTQQRLLEQATALSAKVDAIKAQPPSRHGIAQLDGLAIDAQRLRQLVSAAKRK